MQNKKPRLALITRAQFYPNLVSVLTNLTLMLKDDFSISIVLGKNNTIPEVLSSNCKMIEVDAPKFNVQNLGYSYRAVKAAIGSNADVIMSITQPYPIGVMSCMLAGSKKNIAVVTRITGDFFDEKNIVTGFFRTFYTRYIYEKILVYSLRKASVILPIGKNLEQKFLARDFPKDKLITLAQPFTSQQFAPPKGGFDKKALKEKLNLSVNKTTIIFIARLEPDKGIDKLKSIIEGVLNQSDKFQFCIIGKGSASSEFEVYDKDNVHLTGFIKRDDLPKYYHCADLIVYPTNKDASPTVLLEALAARLPIVATPIGEIPNLTKNLRSSTKEFIEYILSEDYPLDETPDWFDWQVQKQLYVQVIYSALSKKNIKNASFADFSRR